MSYTKAQRDLIASLQYQEKTLARRVRELESDPEYVRLQKEHQEKLGKIHATYEKRIKELTESLRRAENSLEKTGRRWMDVIGDVEAEKDREIAKKEKEIERLNETIRKKVSERKELLREVTALREKVYDLEDEIKKLRARLGMDFTNSSTPSSRTSFRAPVKNSREATGRKPGAQAGHEGHRRPELRPTRPPIVIEAPEDILDDHFPVYDQF